MNKLLRVSLACLFLFASFWGNAQTIVTGNAKVKHGNLFIYVEIKIR